MAGLGADPFPLSRRFDLLLYLVGDFVVVARHGFELLAQCGAPSGEFSLEPPRLILAVEADLKSNAASVARDWLEQGWLDVAVVQPRPDTVHGLAEGTSRLFFDMHDEWAVERHIALLPMGLVRRELFLGGSLLVPRLPVGRTNKGRIQHNRSDSEPILQPSDFPAGMGPKFAGPSLFADTLHDRVIE